MESMLKHRARVLQNEEMELKEIGKHLVFKQYVFLMNFWNTRFQLCLHHILTYNVQKMQFMGVLSLTGYKTHAKICA